MITHLEFKTGDKVETRLSGEQGLIIDREIEIYGVSLLVRFNNGSKKWLRSTDLRFAS